MDLDRDLISDLVRRALEEDLGAAGDVTSDALVPAEDQAQAWVVARQRGVVAGLPVLEEVFRQAGASIRVRLLAGEGQAVEAGTRLAEVSGPARAVLTGERAALNFLQRMCGIATLTRRCVENVRGYDVRILDTRKTTPTLRALEKYAVRMGGGANHRMGLYDQVLIKDNHLRALLDQAGDLPAAVRLAVQRARQAHGPDMRVEVEAESLPMVAAALEAGADIIMLDNMTLSQMAQAAKLVREWRARLGASKPVTEASGGVKPEKLAEIAATGVDSISLGALTHSAPVLDIALDFERDE